MIYFIILFLILFLAIKYDFRPNQEQNKWYNIILVILVFLAGLRYRVGTDTLVYMDEYEAGPSYLSFIKDKYLIGWYLFMKACHSLHLSFYIVQFIIAIVINVGIFRFLRRSMPMATFSLLLMYYVLFYPGWNFEVLRQAICISLFLYALPYLEEKKYIKYYLLVATACTFHEASLFLLLIPLIIRIPVTRKTLSVMIFLLLLFILSAPFIRERVVAYALILRPFQDKAAHYFDAVDLNASFSIANYMFNMVLNVALPLWAIIRNIRTKQFSDSFIILSMISLLTYSLSTMLPMMYRLNYFFVLFSYVMLMSFFVDVSQKISVRGFKTTFFILLIVFLTFKARVYFVEKNNTPMYVHYYPYTNIFNEEKIIKREFIDNLY